MPFSFLWNGVLNLENGKETIIITLLLRKELITYNFKLKGWEGLKTRKWGNQNVSFEISELQLTTS